MRGDGRHHCCLPNSLSPIPCLPIPLVIGWFKNGLWKWKRNVRDICISTFIAALFMIAKTWKQPKCPSADEWIKKMWDIYDRIVLSHKKEQILLFVTMWMDLEGNMRSEINQIEKEKYCDIWHNSYQSKMWRCGSFCLSSVLSLKRGFRGAHVPSSFVAFGVVWGCDAWSCYCNLVKMRRASTHAKYGRSDRSSWQHWAAEFTDPGDPAHPSPLLLPPDLTAMGGNTFFLIIKAALFAFPITYSQKHCD